MRVFTRETVLSHSLLHRVIGSLWLKTNGENTITRDFFNCFKIVKGRSYSLHFQQFNVLRVSLKNFKVISKVSRGMRMYRRPLKRKTCTIKREHLWHHMFEGSYFACGILLYIIDGSLTAMNHPTEYHYVSINCLLNRVLKCDNASACLPKTVLTMCNLWRHNRQIVEYLNWRPNMENIKEWGISLLWLVSHFMRDDM